MIRARQVLLTTLIGILALTSVTLAAARGTTRIGGQVIVLCSGQGFVQSELDDRGNPVGPAHICPDMALAVLAHVGLPPVLPERPRGPAETVPPTVVSLALACPVFEVRVRGPPLSVRRHFDRPEQQSRT